MEKFIAILKRIQLGALSRSEAVAALVQVGCDEQCAKEDVALEFGAVGDVIGDPDSEAQAKKAIAPIMRRRFVGKLTDDETVRALVERGHTEELARDLLRQQAELIANEKPKGGPA